MLDVSIMQRIQDTFARAMDIAAVTVDRDGKPITMPSNFRMLCRMIRSTPEGLERCQRCDSMGGHRAYAMRRPFCYVCEGGLLDAAAPIIVEDRYIGCVLCGQSIPSDSVDQFRERAYDINVRLGLPKDDVRRAVESIPVVPRERFNAAAEMLSVVANHIMELAVSHLTQKRLFAEAQEKAALEAALQEARLSALKAQINPHFLFNSLALIGSAALEEDAPRSQEIAYNLSDLLRYSLRHGISTVQLSEELEMIENYLAIQKLALGDRLESHIDIEPGLDSINIPCMILQPLVENSVIHGAEPVSQAVRIDVTARRGPAGIVITISDNGRGMSPIMVEAINTRSFLREPEPEKKRESIGLRNIMQRLEGEFGDDLRFSVSSTWGSGTCVLIQIPDTKKKRQIQQSSAPKEELSPEQITIQIGQL
jgi:two-component system, LytTR family, sensor kinase